MEAIGGTADTKTDELKLNVFFFFFFLKQNFFLLN